MGEGAGNPTGLMLKSVLMAALLAPLYRINSHPAPLAILTRRLQRFVRERDESRTAIGARF
jgi:hypothetical protein